MKDKSLLAVLDASAIYAVIKNEPINFNLNEILEKCVTTSYNLAEIANKMVLKKQAENSEIWLLLESMVPNIYNVNVELAELATGLSKVIDNSFGISLGDKLCLALGKLLNKPIYTADRAWKQFEELLDLRINLIR